ncbi:MULTISPECIES: DUF2493 domain-containing protein [Bacillus cereus group]|uniref:YspA cpYpsA-related SLOG domain-containing protein n=1 Tax=Bacillus thuringiensis TaxID=1428 RepID=A0A9X7ASE5_BACTU|nr:MULTISPECIES: DUF2493 domain-containing protein [Bacillus cereus group]PFT50897.1 hypothetical protein COK72_02490 [Bacillus thuringiensis]PFY22934.1 hypothetical protein COL44_18810 [Bacillus toyonensis]
MPKVVVAGSRDFKDYKTLHDRLLANLKRFPKEEIEIVSGGARGADWLGEQFAKQYGLKLTVFPAEWEEYGNSAGHRRNYDMAKYSDICFCFWDGASRGTKGMIDLAIRNKIELHLYVA